MVSHSHSHHLQVRFSKTTNGRSNVLVSGLSGRYIRKKAWTGGYVSASSSSSSSSSSGIGSGTGVDSISIGGSDNRFVVGEMVDALDPDSKVGEGRLQTDDHLFKTLTLILTRIFTKTLILTLTLTHPNLIITVTFTYSLILISWNPTLTLPIPDPLF